MPSLWFTPLDSTQIHRNAKPQWPFFSVATYQYWLHNKAFCFIFSCSFWRYVLGVQTFDCKDCNIYLQLFGMSILFSLPYKMLPIKTPFIMSGQFMSCPDMSGTHQALQSLPSLPGCSPNLATAQDPMSVPQGCQSLHQGLSPASIALHSPGMGPSPSLTLPHPKGSAQCQGWSFSCASLSCPAWSDNF